MRAKLKSLNARIETAAPTDAEQAGAPGLTSNPFVGLRPFRSSEDQLFYGRYAPVSEILQMLNRTRFLSIVGSSGCGKSSLIYAGVIPKLRAGFMAGELDHWRVATMKPGESPMRNLVVELLRAFDIETGERIVDLFLRAIKRKGVYAVARFLKWRLRKSPANFLLLVDQFEEIFRFGLYAEESEATEVGVSKHARREEAATFVGHILALSQRADLPAYVVLTMRSDFLGECDAFQELPKALNQGQYLVPRLTRDQRQEAIESPILLYGKTITQRLRNRLLNDVGDEPDQLPVMQHALMRTWEKWRETGEGPLDIAHYEAVGTIKEALSHDADLALEGLKDEGQEEDTLSRKQVIAKRLFQALTEVDAKGRRLRRPVHLSRVVAIIDDGVGSAEERRKEVLEVIGSFTGESRSFLTLSGDVDDDPLVDISHESLIRQWETLRKWVDEEVEERELYLRLAGDAVRRYDPKEAAVALWANPGLQLALNWWNKRQPNEAWASRYHKEFALAEKFLSESARKRADDEAKDERQRQRLRWAVIGLTIMLCVAFGAFIFAARSRSLALRSAREAETTRDELKGQKLVLERQSIDLKSAVEKSIEEMVNAHVATMRALWAQVEAEKASAEARESAEQARREKEAADIARDQARAAQAADRLHRQATKERDQDKFQRALKTYDAAVQKYAVLKDFDGVAHTYSEIGAMRLGQPEAPPELPAENKSASENPRESVTEEVASVPREEFIGVVLGDRQVVDAVIQKYGTDPEDFDELFRDLAIGPEHQKGLADYGRAVNTYRKYRDRNGSAAALNEVGDFLSLADSLDGDDDESVAAAPARFSQRARAQAAMVFFCEALADYTAGASPEGQISMLNKISKRLSANHPDGDEAGGDTEDREGGPVAAAEQSTKPMIYGCNTQTNGLTVTHKDADPVPYMERMLPLYKELLRKGSKHPEEVAEQREGYVSTLITLGKFYLKRRDEGGNDRLDEARGRFDEAVAVYHAANDRKKEAATLIAVGDAYLAGGHKDLAFESFDKALGVHTSTDTLEQRQALSEVLIEVAQRYNAGDEEARLARAAQLFKGAVEVHERADDLKSAAVTALSIGNNLDAGSDLELEFYERAAKDFAAANMGKEEAQIRLIISGSFRLRALQADKNQRQGLFAAALVAAERAREIYASSGTNNEQATALSRIASIYLGMERAEDAEKHYRDILRFLGPGDRRLNGDVYYGIGRALALRGPSHRAEAEKAFKEAYDSYADVRSTIGMRNVQAAVKKLYEPQSQPSPPPPGASPSPAPKPTTPVVDAARGPVKLETDLKGDPSGGQTPEGSAEFEVKANGERELKVEVENLSPPPDATFRVLINGTDVHPIKIEPDGSGKLKLRTRKNEQVPAVGVGDHISVVDSAGRPVVKGLFPADPCASPPK